MSHRYLVLGKYTAQGLAGVVKDGFQSRFETINNAVTSLGGKLIEYSFCTGEYDFVIMVEWEDESKALTLQMVAGAAGTVTSQTIRLLSPSEMDKSRSHISAVQWTAPGT